MPFVSVLLALVLSLSGMRQSASPSPVEKLGDGLYRVGKIRVDTKRAEIAVPGKVNDAMTLEWVANTVTGGKAYESALTLDTDGVTFNAALLLIGLDKKNARVPDRHFDPVPPKGDPVEIWVEWREGGTTRRTGIEQLLYDQRTKAPMEPGGWVYTGSSMYDNNFRADSDGGVLIGFVHSPAPVIENRSTGAVDAFGSVIFNKQLGLLPGTSITLAVKSAPKATPKDRR